MSPSIPALLAFASVASLIAHVGPISSTRAPDPRSPAAGRQQAWDPLGRFGGLVRRGLRQPSDRRADRRAGAAVLVGVGLLLVFPPLAALWGGGLGAWSVLHRRRRASLDDRALVDELPEVVDLLSLAVSAGLTVPSAVEVVAERGAGRFAAELARARERALLGDSLADTIDDIPGRLGDPAGPVVRILSGSLRDGSSIVAALERVANEVRTERRRSAEERARRVSVQLLFPLVCCVLPAFALLTVVPLLAGALSGLLG